MTSAALNTIARVRTALTDAHAAESRNALRTAALNVQVAQVHASHAAAEQLRIANLIAYAELASRDVKTAGYLDAQIQHGLDLPDMADDYAEQKR